jgi:CubicO group peptidase (beta-lactamase class C family)
MINGGKGFGGQQVVPDRWVRETYSADPGRQAAFARGESAAEMPGAEYHNQAWALEPERVVAMLGIHGQFAHLDRANDLMVVGLSSFPDQANSLLGATLTQLWSQITDPTA